MAANYDLFADLDDDALQAMFFGKTIRATAIGESILEAAKPTLHALFKKLAPAVDPMVGAEVAIAAATGKQNYAHVHFFIMYKKLCSFSNFEETRFFIIFVNFILMIV